MIRKLEAILSLLPNAKVSGSDDDIKWLGANGEWDGAPLLTEAEIAAEQSRMGSSAIKALSLSTINAARDAKLAVGFTHNGILWHSDAIFQSQVQGFVLAYVAGVLPPTATVTIRAKDDTLRLLTLDELKALAAAMMAYVQGAYAASWAEKDAGLV